MQWLNTVTFSQLEAELRQTTSYSEFIKKKKFTNSQCSKKKFLTEMVQDH